MHPYATGATPDRIHPIVYGSDRADASIHSGTPNFSVTRDTNLSAYSITIAGETHSPSYVITVAPITGLFTTLFVAGSSALNGHLLVFIRDGTGASVKSEFNFVVFRPGS